jgi:hypothetical protein
MITKEKIDFKEFTLHYDVNEIMSFFEFSINEIKGVLGFWGAQDVN